MARSGISMRSALGLMTVLAGGALFLVACTSGSGGGSRADGGGVIPGRDSGPLPPGVDGGPTGRPDGAPLPTGDICEETCRFSGDMECDDGGPDSLTSICDFGTDCMDCGTRNSADCTPDCEGNNCGPDGCGGFCGDCGAGESCMSGTCGVCTPECEGRSCGSDGCGGTCGECSGGAMCYRNQCQMPMCEGRTCGSDAAGGRCAPDDCGMGSTCREGSCATCSCEGRECGSDGCGMTCGDGCAEGVACDDLTGRCVPSPDPNCNNTCGTSGDNECDDGGPGSLFSLCELGTDCADCGTRSGG